MRLTTPLKPHIRYNAAVVMFKSNAQLQAAFDSLSSVIPKTWAKRGRLAYQVFPIDDSYGDIEECGYLAVKWMR